MNKEEENKLSNAIITLHLEIKGLRQDMDRQLGKVNLGLQEMRTSYMQLDERFNRMSSDINGMRSDINGMRLDLNEKIDGLRSDLKGYAESNNALLHNHETRIVRLEETRGSSFVAEPKAEYRVKKNKKKK